MKKSSIPKDAVAKPLDEAGAPPFGEHEDDEAEARLDADAREGLVGKLLIAMPGIGDPRFERSVIFMVSHNDSGAMGLIVNRASDELTFPDLLTQLKLDVSDDAADLPVRFGGPVDVERGFVLHSTDYHRTEATRRVNEGVSLTATIDVLRALARGDGPERAMFALGYAGWGPGQLEREIQENGWLYADPEPDTLGDILFDEEDDPKWRRALGVIGVDPSLLSSEGGRA